MNLLVEYCKRHGVNFVWGNNEGIVFLDDYNRPAVVCITSSAPRQIITCGSCPTDRSNLVVELFVPSRDSIFSPLSHSHQPPDVDLLKHFCDIGHGGYKPYKAKNQTDVETWLWRFFIFHNKTKYSTAWRRFSAEQSKDESPMKYIEQMAWVAIKHPKVYHDYYHMYQMLTTARNYLLFE